MCNFKKKRGEGHKRRGIILLVLPQFYTSNEEGVYKAILSNKYSCIVRISWTCVFFAGNACYLETRLTIFLKMWLVTVHFLQFKSWFSPPGPFIFYIWKEEYKYIWKSCQHVSYFCIKSRLCILHIDRYCLLLINIFFSFL